MNKSLMWFLGIVIVIALVGLIFYVTQNDTAIHANVNTNSSSNSASNSVENEILDINKEDMSDHTLSQAGAVTRISIIDSGFVPESMTIEVGDTVTWKNDSRETAYVAPDDDPSHAKYLEIWDDDGTGEIAPGEEYSFTFIDAGTYTYHNHLNALETGIIIVE